jgi:MYXO-CTERM domain-containing protein
MVTTSGEATCKFLSDDQHPQCQVLHVTTGQKGGGCSCDVGGTDMPSGIALGFAALGLVMTARQRRRRRA